MSLDDAETSGVQERPRRGPRIGGSALFGLACAVLFVSLWGRVLIAHRVMVGVDVLYTVDPWAATSGVPAVHNVLVTDGIEVFLPWLAVIRQALAAGRLPLWDPYALFGGPLLANGQAAPFSPFTLLAAVVGGAWGMSLAMLAKLWVAGVGVFVFLRSLGVRGAGAVLGGLAFATGSFMIVWLHGQNSAVAAWLPWVFAAIEWYLRRPRGRRLAVLAFVIGLQFLGGQPDASLYLCVGVALYGIVRGVTPGHRAALPGLVAAAVVGVLVASVQLVPFAAVLHESGTVGSRGGAGLGLIHLPVTYLDSWLVPNLHGNPAIDKALGRAPNYSESTGFVGVTALVLALPGLVFQWKRDRSTLVALALVGLVSAGIVYGVLTPVVGRLPGLESGRSYRMLMLVCLVVACLGGIGFDGLARRSTRPGLSVPGLVASVVGLGALAAVAVGGALLLRLGARIDGLGPTLHPGWVTFWAVFGAASLIGAVGFAAAAWFRMGTVAMSGLAVLALLEGAVFAGPFQPQLPSSEVLPHSAAVDWLVAHAGGRTFAAQGDAFSAETPTLYGLHDARGYGLTKSPRVDIFWSHADPTYTARPYLGPVVTEPGARWLAAAGVRYFMTHGDTHLSGTIPVYQGEGVTISRVPRARPFAFSAPSVRWVGSPQQAGRGMSADPLGSVYLEGSGSQQAGHATVKVESRQPGHIELGVNADQPAEIVVLQSYAPDWNATVDGRQARVAPADVLFQAVRVPAGTHTVVLDYRPTSVVLGIALTGAGLLVVVLLLVFNPGLPRGRRRRRGKGSTV